MRFVYIHEHLTIASAINLAQSNVNHLCSFSVRSRSIGFSPYQLFIHLKMICCVGRTGPAINLHITTCSFVCAFAWFSAGQLSNKKIQNSKTDLEWKPKGNVSLWNLSCARRHSSGRIARANFDGRKEIAAMAVMC